MARPTLSGRVCFGPPHGYPEVTSPTVTPERFTVEPQHIFVEVLGRVDAERFGVILPESSSCRSSLMFAGKLEGVPVVSLGEGP